MPSPRTRRLMLDHQMLVKRLANWPLITISGTAGLPPEIYRFTYHLRGLYVAPTGEILERDNHLLEVNLSLGYPRHAPQCRMLTPIFHPNFDNSTVCIGDFWAASEGLDDLVIRIGRMITYQEYNTKSPLNGLAAKWAAQNARLLPIDRRSVAPPAVAVPQTSAPAAMPDTQRENTAEPIADTVVMPSPAEPASPLSVEIAPPPAEAEAPDNTPDPWAEKIVIS